MFLWGGGGGRFVPPAPTIQTSVKFRHFKELYLHIHRQITFKLGSFTHLKALFPAESDFLQLVHVKSLKKCGTVYCADMVGC